MNTIMDTVNSPQVRVNSIESISKLLKIVLRKETQ